MDNCLVRLQAPCSPLDVETMQTWLEDMARKGYLLKEGVFWGDRYLFYRISPLSVRYRLTPVANELERWNEAPDSEHQTIADAYGWEYVCTLGYLHVYRAYSDEAIELHTEPAIHAESLRQLLTRSIRSTVLSLLMPVFYGTVFRFLLWSGSFWLQVMRDGLLPYSIVTVVCLRAFFRGIRNSMGLWRLYRRFRQGDLPVQRREWRKKQRMQRRWHSLRWVLYFCLVFAVWGWRQSNLEQMAYHPLPEEHPPFVTVEDLVEDCGHLEKAEPLDVSEMRSWSTFVSPVNYEWWEVVDITTMGGKTGRVSLEVSYHEPESDYVADQLAKEYQAKIEGEARGEATVVRTDRAVIFIRLVYRDFVEPCFSLDDWLARME